MILTQAEHNSPYLAGSFSLSYRLQLKSEDLAISENSGGRLLKSENTKQET